MPFPPFLTCVCSLGITLLTSTSKMKLLHTATALILLVHSNAVDTSPSIRGGEQQQTANWPSTFMKQGLVGQPGSAYPTTTAEALDAGWQKSDEPCQPLLGEAWLKGGERSIDTSATMYFTPRVGNNPGVFSAIEVDYYGYIEENLVGMYFSDEKTAKDGTYHSLAVALCKPDDQGLCDKDIPVKRQTTEYIAISPDMANTVVPIREDSPELISGWKQGSCLHTMGFHWLRDIVGGKDLTYQAENTVPVVPMYSSIDGSINGIFFLATDKKQNCPSYPCKESDLNFWDASPGLTLENKGKFYMCANLCGECQFEGSGSSPGMYTTMHWFFKDVFPGSEDLDLCYNSEGQRQPQPYCRSDEYPVSTMKNEFVSMTM